jgi:hypothetical protein
MKGIDIFNIIVLVFVICLCGAGIIIGLLTAMGAILFASGFVTMLIAAMANSALEA